MISNEITPLCVVFEDFMVYRMLLYSYCNPARMVLRGKTSMISMISMSNNPPRRSFREVFDSIILGQKK
ncbi:hypothetical protein Y032_0913g3012 [Ancylostoma ceylanicum]|uniref:Uncharacterized protein n=1 Tax=Ancylostoma ceylanicum TaxID=53326 RepID=A0A016W9H4_9BILA|nr:hypothetical protein Y032_0913g3012 [Ancylostoma ceylanicum]